MALVDDGMPCAICGKPIDDVSTCFTTTMVGLQLPLSRLDDSAAHPECVDAWEHKTEFVEAYNARWKERQFEIDDAGHVKWVGRERPLIPWWMWLLMPLLLPVSLIYNAVSGAKRAWFRGSHQGDDFPIA
jgi:hypothetical protein